MCKSFWINSPSSTIRFSDRHQNFPTNNTQRSSGGGGRPPCPPLATPLGTWLGTTESVVASDEIEAVTVLATLVFAASLDTASVAKGTTASDLADDGAGG